MLVRLQGARQRLGIYHGPRRRRRGLGTAGSSSGSTRRYRRASIRTQDASGTSRSRSRDAQPNPKRVAVSTSSDQQKLHGQRTRSQLAIYWTMYSFASLAALTRVSVPWTGRANESMMTSDVPTTLPCMRPMISYGTPDRAWITYGTRGLSDRSEAPKRDRSPF